MPAGFTSSFDVETGVRQRAVAGLFLFNLAVDGTMRRTVKQRPADVVLAQCARSSADLGYADDVVKFDSSSLKLQYVIDLVSKLAAAYGQRLCSDKCKQM
ncbi:hypothetical protein RB195_018181 [Necator americanus]